MSDEQSLIFLAELAEAELEAVEEDEEAQPRSTLQERMALEDEETQYRYWFDRALNILTRREHSEVQLRQKLRQRGTPLSLIDAIIERLYELNYLSLERFSKSHSRNRAYQGYGPIRIRMELLQQGIDEGLIEIAFSEIDWSEARERAERKVRQRDPLKRKQALYRRGFI